MYDSVTTHITLLTLPLNKTKRFSLEFISRSGRWYKDTDLIDLLELETNDMPNISIMQALNNPINIFKNKSKHYFILFLTIKYFCECLICRFISTIIINWQIIYISFKWYFSGFSSLKMFLLQCCVGIDTILLSALIFFFFLCKKI